MTLSSLQRYGDAVCYVVGDVKTDRASTFWVDKETFFPVRYLIRKSGRTMDVRYDNWHMVSQSWYPMETRIFMDGELFVQISVDQMELTPKLSPARFDVKKIISRYPRKDEGGPGKAGHDAGMDNLDKEIETFNKLYD